MNEEYLKYWGLSHHPFLLAPDGNMMCITGQYFECFERLKYAISTNKGGVLVASEDAGLGKTTTLLKLIDDMKEEHGKNFRFAYIDHPTISSDQMIGQITGLITGEMPSEDKVKNLSALKEALIETKKEGGKNLIIIDEGQMLCDSRSVLQEMRILINLTHNNEYLHTFIFSGQKALWDTLQDMPEFWQRLPVRYYFTPLRYEETRELIRHRLNRAGLDVARELFAEDAIEIIHKYSKGLPRTIIAVSDLALLNGYSDKTRKIGFKEVSKAINAMSGRGETIPYIVTEKKGEVKEPAAKAVFEPQPSTMNRTSPNAFEYISHNARQTFFDQSFAQYLKPLVMALLVLLFIFVGAAGYRLFSSPRQAENTVIIKEIERPVPPSKQVAAENPQTETTQERTGNQPSDQTIVQPPASSVAPPEKDVIAAFKEEMKNKKERVSDRIVVVKVDAANVRSAPNLESPRILTIVRGEMLPVIDEKSDQTGMKWYKVNLYSNRTGWIAGIVANPTTR